MPCPIQVGAFTVVLPKGPKRVFYAEIGGWRQGMQPGEVGLIGVLEALVRELWVWGLNQPKLGDGHPPVVGDYEEGPGYMGGTQNQRDIRHCYMYLPCGKQAVCGLADGRQLACGKKTTLVAVWIPCTGAGGGQVYPALPMLHPECCSPAPPVLPVSLLNPSTAGMWAHASTAHPAAASGPYPRPVPGPCPAHGRAHTCLPEAACLSGCLAPK